MDANRNGKRRRPVVAIINSTVESIDLLTEFLHSEGVATVDAYVIEFKRGMRNFDAFFRDYQPQAVIYDIGIPYIENWTFFNEQVLARDLLPASAFVITTANRTVLEALVGTTQAIELIGCPADLDIIAGAVKKAIANSGAAKR
jgi:hypothetical protein